VSHFNFPRRTLIFETREYEFIVVSWDHSLARSIARSLGWSILVNIREFLGLIAFFGEGGAVVRKWCFKSKQDLPLDTRSCLRGTEEENHGVESHKNLAGEEYLENFSFLPWRQRHDDQCAFNCVLNTDRRFNAAFRTSENKMVMYSIASKLDSIF